MYNGDIIANHRIHFIHGISLGQAISPGEPERAGASDDRQFSRAVPHHRIPPGHGDRAAVVGPTHEGIRTRLIINKTLFTWIGYTQKKNSILALNSVGKCPLQSSFSFKTPIHHNHHSITTIPTLSLLHFIAIEAHFFTVLAGKLRLLVSRLHDQAAGFLVWFNRPRPRPYTTRSTTQEESQHYLRLSRAQMMFSGKDEIEKFEVVETGKHYYNLWVFFVFLTCLP
nr:hypothetical protein Iba_chr01cCG16660 [Ipomoea batatas]